MPVPSFFLSCQSCALESMDMAETFAVSEKVVRSRIVQWLFLSNLEGAIV